LRRLGSSCAPPWTRCGPAAWSRFRRRLSYGLAVPALDAGSVRADLRAEGRPESKPLLVLVDSMAMAEAVACVTPAARDLMMRYWPGALTLVLPARAKVPRPWTAGTGTLGLRLSPHPIARGLVDLLGEPVTLRAPIRTASRPPTTGGRRARLFSRRIDLVLDGGATPAGNHRTVLDLTVEPRESCVRAPWSCAIFGPRGGSIQTSRRARR